MKKVFLNIIVLFALLFAIPVSAFAAFDIKEWFSGVGIGAIALAITAIIALAGLVSHAKWLSAVLVAVGQFFTTFGVALQDGKVDKDELTAINERRKEILASVKKKE